MSARAFLAVLHARLHAQRRIVLYSCAAAFVAGLFQPAGYAAPLFLCSLLGIALALAQSPGLHRYLDRCEQSAPLYGRELARAKALVPCLAAAFGVVAFALGGALRGSSGLPLTMLVTLAALVPATLIALSATIRRGTSRVLYVALAGAACGIAYMLVTVANSVYAELGFCAIVAFLGVRQYGETLARYDPI